MNSKKIRMGVSIIILAVLLVIGVVLFFILQSGDRKNLNKALDESITFAQMRIGRYNDYLSNDQIKSLVRLQDKSEALSWIVAEENNFDEQKLGEYVDDQKLTGALILDSNLQTVMQISEETESKDLWQDTIEGSYVADIIKYPQKTYITRVTMNGIIYDFAAVSRRDNSGVVITYVKKSEMSETHGDLMMESLFEDFPFEMNGVLVVCKDNIVVSSNNSELLGKSTEDYKETLTSDTDGIAKLTINGAVWYGRKDAAEDYTIYMFFPENQVFMQRNVVCLVYVVVAILIYLTYILRRNHSDKIKLAREQKRLRIINAIGQAYSSIYLVDLNTNKPEVVKSSEEEEVALGENILKKTLQDKYVNVFVAPPYRADFIAYMDMNTVVERLDNQKSLAFTFQKMDGSWMLSMIMPQRYDKQGNIDAVLIANRNVTVEKKHEIEQDEALRNALAAAEYASKAKSTFLSSMSHDIRTPMNAIIGFTALAQTHIDDRAQVQDYLTKINTSSTFLLSLINDILDMSRIESGSVKLDERSVHIPDLLHDLRAMIQGLVNSKNLNLYIDAQDVVHEDVIADKLRLNQVILNIVSNAIKFTQPGGDIIIRLIEKPCSIKNYTTYEISVKDNGIGISQEFLDHIFDNFSREQTATVSGVQGTGLGMAITKNIVDMMGGEIHVESEEGKGSLFTVTLNLRLADKIVKNDPIPSLLGARALVVDDDLNTCRSVSKMLRDIQMRPDWTTSGKEAIVRAQDAADIKDEYKVYIIDYLMPDMNGIETVRSIRKVISEDAAIIVLTAYDWADFEHEAREAGVTAFVSKPIFMSELRDVLTQPMFRESVVKAEKRKTYDYSGKRILLVEDNKLNREIATAILEDTGMIIDSVSDGDVAVAAINGAPPDKYDLVLMDIQMPKMDGYTATKEIRNLPDEKKANIPIVAMTANAFEKDKQKAYASGMNGHIIKPISIDEIAKIFDEIFAKNDQN